MLEEWSKSQAFDNTIAKPLLEVSASAAGRWGGRVDAFSKRLLVVELPAGEQLDGSNCVIALFGKAFSLVAVSLFLCQCLNDGSEVLASVGLEAEAESDRGGSGNKVALQVAAVEGVLVDLFDLGGPSAMVCCVDRLSLVVAEMADAMLNNSPELFPEAVCAIMCQQLLKIRRMDCEGLVHVRVEVADVSRIPLVVSSCSRLVVALDVAPQVVGGNSVLRMHIDPLLADQTVAIWLVRWRPEERTKVLLGELFKKSGLPKVE